MEPAQTLRFWTGLPSDFKAIDAAYERANDSQIVFFIGHSYWVFSDTRVNQGYPRPTSDLGLPPGTVVGAVFVWPHNGHTYFFKDTHYWRFKGGNVEADSTHPRSIPRDLMFCSDLTTISPRGPRTGQKGEDGLCLCGASGQIKNSFSAWILILLWMIC
ncbi:hypothetical protein E2320_003278 [Naja naja]|nr:hypothetical protein E2320_003278 [Naja naja]